MNRFIKISFTLLLLSSIIFAENDKDFYFKMSRSIDIFGRVYKEVNQNYVDALNPEEFILAGIKGMLSSLDPYTIFVDESLQKDMDVITKGKYGGIGATIGLRNEKVTVVDLIEGYSAQRQGIRIGDVIKEIDGLKIDKDNYKDLSLFIKGEPGTEVSMLIDRDGNDDEIVFNLVREEVEIKNLTYYGFVPEESNNVYLKLSGFTRTAGDEIKRAISELKKQKEIKSLVLDLRGNPGGLLDVAIDVAEKFVKKNQLVVSVANRDSFDVKEYYSKEEPIVGDTKLVVLVDKGTASASEIVAGAIQDHDRGIVLGTRSFGKGLVQTVIPLSHNTSLKITTAKYFTPSGRSIQKINYSNKNKVFENTTIIDSTKYSTDNSRVVRGAGGIEPDTVVTNEVDCEQFKDLVAQGMFFKFATKYFNANDSINFSELSDEKLFTDFKQYLGNQDFKYKSKPEKLLAELKKISDKDNYGEQFNSTLDELLKKTETFKQKEIELQKEFIVAEIKKELAGRTDGRDGRIKEYLNTDKQFDIALEILQNEELYNRILKISE
ncbi:MAG: S41 family peptidase [Ignavibacteriae bacterium]|nr:S41 family peptidase [Ignavibacteriota bacterium]NOG97380.1 S41 family peptidase [Ignavibacteriota bacterium]